MIERTTRKRFKRPTTDEMWVWTEKYYVVAKCDLKCEEAIYPCRPSEKREYKRKGDPPGVPRVYEYPNMDESTWTYPSGKFTTWLQTNEIRNALKCNHVVAVHEAIVTIQNIEHKRKWRELCQQVFKCYGKKCMRCGKEQGRIEVDHIKQWATNPSLRYDIENLQVLCIDCHKWKTEQNRLNREEHDLDFRQLNRAVE